MNFEELIDNNNGIGSKQEPTPFGLLYKKKEDNKYVNVLDLRPELADHLLFCEDLKQEGEANRQLDHPGQMRFTVSADSGGIYAVNINQGTYRTFAHLLEENPAVVTGKNFMEDTISQLAELCEYLHGQGICHVCFSPDNVFTRKGDLTPMLLFHGSAYANVDPELLYKDCRDYVAPEVMAGGSPTERSDVYSLGRFMQFLYSDTPVPFELKRVISKATSDNPDKRYPTPKRMVSAMKRRTSLRQSLIMLLAAAIIALVCLGLYVSLIPEQDDIEFVNPAPETAEGDSLDSVFDPFQEANALIDAATDSSKHIDERQMKIYEAKAEQIFRKQFTREATRILSKVYDNSHMNNTEKQFMAASESMTAELVKAQSELAAQAGINNARSQLIASEIIENITNQKKKEMKEAEKKKDE